MRAVFILLAAVNLIELHGPAGQTMYVNPAQISTLREPIASDLRSHFPRNTRCIVVTTNGKFLATVETCTQIRAAIMAP